MTIAPDALENPVELDEAAKNEPIPAGWVKDKDTGEYRPPKRRGRIPNPPPTEHEPIERGEDTPPNSKNRKPNNNKPIPRWKQGVIAKGMAKFYRRVGKIIKAMDRDIGIAVIEAADDCGEAWDELARTNPRIRAVLLKLISGGAWAQLIMAHAPILLAILLKDAIRKHIPFNKFLENMMEPDSDGTSEVSDLLGVDVSPQDMQQMVGMLMGGPLGNMVAGMMQQQATPEEPE